jgi:hypothetical protein
MTVEKAISQLEGQWARSLRSIAQTEKLTSTYLLRLSAYPAQDSDLLGKTYSKKETDHVMPSRQHDQTVFDGVRFHYPGIPARCLGGGLALLARTP